MHWLFLIDRKWLFLFDSTWLIQPDANNAAGKRSRVAAALQEAEMYCRYARGSGDRTFCDQPDREKSNDHQLQIEDCKPVCIMGAGTERKRSGGQRKRSAAWYYRIKHVGVHIFAIKLL